MTPRSQRAAATVRSKQEAKPAAGDTSRRDTRPERSTVLVGAAVLVGLAVRVVWVAYAARQPVGLYDPARYAGFAAEIAKGHGYVEPLTGKPTAYYPPGYPYFLGIIDAVLRHTPLSDDLVLMAGYGQAVIGAATCAAGAVVARRLLSPAAGAVAAFGLALYPNLVFHSAALLSETLYNFLFLAALAVLCWRPWSEGLSRHRLVGFSVLFAAAVLTRPISVAVLPFLFLAWWVDAGRPVAALRRLGVVVAVLVMVLVPWTIRNAVRMDSFVAVSTNTGDNLCIGHYPDARGAFALTERCRVQHDLIRGGPEGEVRHDHEATSLGLHYLWGHLSREPWLVTQRARYLFESDHDGVLAVQSYRADHWMPDGTETMFSRIADAYYAPVALLGAIGLVMMALTRRPERLLLVGASLATVAVPLAFFGDSRFKVPVMPLLTVSAAVLVCGAPALWREIRPNPPNLS